MSELEKESMIAKENKRPGNELSHIGLKKLLHSKTKKKSLVKQKFN
jgi:hypothetical protein